MSKKIIYYTMVVLVVLGMAGTLKTQGAEAVNCPDLRIVFARGSGGERWQTDDYLTFKSTIEQKLATVNLNYEFIDLDYPAVGVGLDKLDVTLGAFFGAGDAYEFGASVNAGVKDLVTMVNENSCPSTKYVLGGYSQGAMVISKSLGSLNAERVIYASTFGDPKLYLPEGAGLMPAACRGANLSDYRMYVPDCQAHKGLLGAYIPYEPSTFAGKVGTWCNKRDIFCSSHFGISDHLTYVADDLYEDASLVIFDKITKTFGLENHISSPHDTAILIDTTNSMSDLIEMHEEDILKLARETFQLGGRVALYDYRDLNDPYQPVQYCDFETCTIETIEYALENIDTGGGGDQQESGLSAAFHVMKELKWRKGATKSLVILTDADFLSPDRDGITFDQVVALSKTIDPVNFYIITRYGRDDLFTDLAEATDGGVASYQNDVDEMLMKLIGRYDSLSRVEESFDVAELPTVTIDAVAQEDSEVKVDFTLSNGGTRALVVLNEAILGVVEGNSVTVGGLDRSVENILTIVPLGDDVRGEGVEVKIAATLQGEANITEDSTVGEAGAPHIIDLGWTVLELPKAPNTGRL